MFNKDFNSLLEVIQEFSTEEKCITHLEELYWQGVPVSPFDETSKVYKCKGGKYKCKNTGKYFTVKTGTMFDNTKVPLTKWFAAIYLVISHKKGISSVQLPKDLGGISQKSAWHLLMRIRKCLGIENYNEIGGEGLIVESDESFYGGKNKFRHANKKVKNSQGRSWKDKTAVTGMIERGGKLTAIVTVNTAAEVMQPVIKKYVVRGSILVSDDWRGYNGLSTHYHQYTIKHSDKGYKHDYDSSIIHTNTIENSWKIMKNSLRDMYNSVKRKHLQSYVDEFVFRYNTRNYKGGERFNYLLLNSNKRTKYKDLMNAENR
ncbi:IS1595 family transposase [Flavobacterium salilacus subsp. salilacus]|uniref:IS1595 family transposase n=1 Tax=Flavobacterium TaxID=237 RepID=UPI001074BD17|nr:MULTISPECIES: IS1595 family transposase [Flavobacterium]KAF2518121.1 IS1595 family transposase [Flavobacterium salilacus subsp. salilacus]MBE1615569.1 IS1595 family transposase [Flavobacterium sp. SaA2.13]